MDKDKDMDKNEEYLMIDYVILKRDIQDSIAYLNFYKDQNSEEHYKKGLEEIELMKKKLKKLEDEINN